jgi:hypothetical protein
MSGKSIFVEDENRRVYEGHGRSRRSGQKKEKVGPWSSLSAWTCPAFMTATSQVSDSSRSIEWYDEPCHRCHFAP